MDFRDTPDEAAWRREVRAFVERELPQSLKADLLRQLTPGMQDWDRPEARVWRSRLAEKGWIAPSWPREYGGAGLTLMQQFIMSEEFAEANAPRVGGNGIEMLGPTLILHGSDEQKREFLPKILSGEIVFAQGFTEPEAGSDLASLRMEATQDGDDYILNGHKIWTTGAIQCNWMFLLARTNPSVPKHRGISYFLVEMSSPGIDVRRMLDLTGSPLASQVYFKNVRIPAAHLVGEENQGWYMATTTLNFERAAQMGSIVGLRHAVEELARLHMERRSTAGAASLLRQELADRMIEVQVARMMAYRIVTMLERGQEPVYQASMMKTFLAETTQRVAQTGMRILGLRAALREESGPAVMWVQELYVASLALTIGMGTSEVLRNVIATRGLGLPRG
jgi:alkylation response protein AidB-like acyl-CoA dehydrogenase